MGLLIFGLGTGVLVAENWAEMPTILKQIKVLGSTVEKIATPAASALNQNDSGQASVPKFSCKTRDFSSIGVSGCFPDDWVKTDEEGPRGILLGGVVLQSSDFKVLVDQGSDGTPEIRIKSGYQLSIRATRITVDSSKATMADLKAFWEANRAGHAIARQEDRTVGGQPALYHFLSIPKEGGQTDTHIIKDSLLYDINFYFRDGQNGQGENFYRDILDKISFGTVDPKLQENSDQITVSPMAGPTVAGSLRSSSEAGFAVEAGQPMTITIVKNPSLEISSQTELPMIIRRVKTNRATVVLGIAKPQGDGVNQGTYALTWLAPETGVYEIVAQVIKNDGMIYESAAVGVTVVSSKSKP